MIKVENIRNRDIRITTEPIVYYWWFKTTCFSQLLSLLSSEINLENIVVKEINNEQFGLLYIGKGKNGNDRLIKYHIHDSQNFHSSGIENGRLSSLRQTLCGLLQLPMSSSKIQINDFIDQNCIVDYETCSLEKLDKHEHETLRRNYLPLNYQNTKGILSANHRKILTQSKKRMKI